MPGRPPPCAFQGEISPARVSAFRIGNYRIAGIPARVRPPGMPGAGQTRIRPVGRIAAILSDKGQEVAPHSRPFPTPQGENRLSSRSLEVEGRQGLAGAARRRR